MNNRVAVRGRQGTRDLGAILDRDCWRQRPSTEHGSQCLAIEQLGYEIGSRAVGTDVVHRQNVRMIEPAGCGSLLREAVQPLSIGRV